MFVTYTDGLNCIKINLVRYHHHTIRVLRLDNLKLLPVGLLVGSFLNKIHPLSTLFPGSLCALQELSGELVLVNPSWQASEEGSGINFGIVIHVQFYRYSLPASKHGNWM